MTAADPRRTDPRRADPPRADLADPTVAAIRRDLLAWYDRNRRDLPWRRREDAYGIWLSEIMLQQTRVETVIPYYERFLTEYPTVDDLAAADLDDVLARWSGLGYYRRARALHETARIVVREHAGEFPTDPDDVRALPGIGRYTAGAISSIAHGLPEPIVDGNVIRILSRWLRLGEQTKPARYWDLAERLVPRDRPGDFNQAMMELGATVCTPRSPSCGLCPVRDHCEAARAGEPESYPATAKRQKSVDVASTLVVIRRNGRVLLTRSPSRPIMKDLWEFPSCEFGGDAPTEAARFIQSAYGRRFDAKTSLPEIRHSIMNRRIRLHPVVGTIDRGPVRPVESEEAVRWIRPSELADYPVGGIAKKVVRGLSKLAGLG